ncbi:MAG: NAD(+)/NADH kinase [Candidatus Aenigmatarchaeota archaeon]
MKILIAAKQNAVGLRSAKKLEKELNKFSDVEFDPSTAKKLKKFRARGTAVKKFDGDLVISLGGDGTFLWTGYQTQVPILPVRLEGYGFLCSVNFKELIKNLDKVQKKEYDIIPQMRMRCVKSRKGILDRIMRGVYPLSINEIAFARKRPSKILDIEVSISGGPVMRFSGDGVLFATPAGSTAYAASAGGAVLDPSLEAVVMVPLYPFNSKVKPLVIPSSKKIQVVVKAGDCALIIDGHSGDYFKSNSEFTIEKGEPINVVHLFENRFYDKFKKVFIDSEMPE